MKTKVFITLVFSIVALLHMTSYTTYQDTDGPHGGTLKKAENFYIEMRNPYDHFYAFLYNRMMKPVSNKNIFCSVRFYYNDSTSTDMVLEPFEEDGFVSASTVPNYVTCKVMFNVQGKTVEAKFDNTTYIVKKKK